MKYITASDKIIEINYLFIRNRLQSVKQLFAKLLIFREQAGEALQT